MKIPMILRWRRRRKERRVLIQIGASLMHELKNNRPLRRKIKDTDLEKRLNYIMSRKDW